MTVCFSVRCLSTVCRDDRIRWLNSGRSSVSILNEFTNVPRLPRSKNQSVLMMTELFSSFKTERMETGVEEQEQLRDICSKIKREKEQERSK